MIKTRWVRNAAVLGTVITLSVAGYQFVSEDGALAASLCQETEMAGLSVSMDKYYAQNFADVDTEDVADVAQGVEDTTATALPAPAAGAAQNAKAQTSAKTEEQRKEETVAKQFRDLGISTASDYVNIRKSPSTESKIVGKLYRGSAAKIVAENKSWVKINSGTVVGYIRKDLLARGANAQKLAGKFGVAYAFVNKGVTTLNVRSKKSTSASIVTQIPEDEKYEIVGESDNWYKIEIDDGTRGYVAKEFVHTHVNFKKAISIKEEQEKIRRQQEAERAEQERLAALQRQANAASQPSTASNSNSTNRTNSSNRSNSTYRSNSSNSSRRSSSNKSSSSKSSNSKSSSNNSYSAPSSGSGSSIASYACKFVGNPYSWGGSSLTRGADCSGFTMSVYAQFGYSLPHSAAAQAGRGRKVSLSSLQPGDLIFYRNGSRIGHVALYIGGGRVVHASNKKDGIKISNYRYRQPACARRIIG